MSKNYVLIKSCLSFIALSLLAGNGYPQTAIVKGFVVDEQNLPVEDFYAVFLDKADSSMLAKGVFTDGWFSLECPPAEGLLQISDTGHEKAFFPVKPVGVLDLDTIRLKSLSLNEVVVQGRRPVLQHSGGKMVLHVQSTVLEQAGSAMDVLRRAPGIQVDNDDQITVFGKGTPLIYMNNKEVQSVQELEILQSGNIEKVEIDRTPSSRYESSARAVIRVTTHRQEKNKLNAEIFNRIFFGRRISNRAGVTLNMPTGKFSPFLSYNFQTLHNKNYFEEYENNYQTAYTIKNRATSVKYPGSDVYNLITGTHWKPDEKHSVDVQYQFYRNDYTIDTHTGQTIFKDDEEPVYRRIIKTGGEYEQLHNASLLYQAQFDSLRSLLIASDYAIQRNRGATNIDESNITQSSAVQSVIDNKDDYRVFTMRTEYGFPFFRDLKATTGAKFSAVDNEGGTKSMNTSEGEVNYNDSQDITDHIAAGYFNLAKKFGKGAVQAALRFEHTHTKIKANSEAVLDTAYLSIFPSAEFSYALADEREIVLSLSKKINRPSFSELNPSVTYFDSLAYGQGNPLLKPAKAYSIELEYPLPRGFAFSVAYTYNKDARIETAVNDEQNPDIVKYVPVNIDESGYIDCFLHYSYSGKIYHLNVSNCIEFPFVDVPYMGSVRKLRDPSWDFTINNDVVLGKHVRLFCNFNYRSRSVDLMTTLEPCYNLSAGVSCELAKDRLLISLEGNDLLNTNDREWNDKYGNIESGQKPDFDTRYIRLMIRYRLNNFRNMFKRHSDSQEELKRL